MLLFFISYETYKVERGYFIIMLDFLMGLLGNPWFYVSLVIISVLFYGMFSRLLGKTITKKQLLWIGVIGAMVTFGIFGTLGLSSTGSLASNGIAISGFQTVTAYGSNGSSDSSTDTDVRHDFYLDEADVTGNTFIDTGVWELIREGNLDPNSCKVEIIKPARYDISDTTYHIVDEDTNSGKMYAYVRTCASSSCAAAATHSQEAGYLAFADGVAVGYVGVNITIDETGFDPLTQYDTKTVLVNACGHVQPIVMHKNDA
jgi:hypothetical protein